MQLESYRNCTLCPRKCGADRFRSPGFCGASAEMRVARAALHFWEEPVISGKKGSGTIFFSGCTMRCAYCQNFEISRTLRGKTVSPERLTEIFFELQEAGAHNINLVTGDMYLPSLFASMDRARKQGFPLPFILNTSSYLRAETLKPFEGLLDIYLADMKYIRNEDALRYSIAPGYVEAAKEAIQEMVRQQPLPVIREEKVDGETISLMKKGVILRHLLLPGMVIQGKMIVKYMAETYGERVLFSLMNQYTPVGNTSSFPELERKVTDREYDSLIDYAAAIGVTKGFMQEGETALESFIPPFSP